MYKKVALNPGIYFPKRRKISLGGIFMTTEEKANKLYLKKLTLEAWTMILHKQGKISLAKCNKMIAMIEKLSA